LFIDPAFFTTPTSLPCKATDGFLLWRADGARGPLPDVMLII
jgi:hypothetical protein